MPTPKRSEMIAAAIINPQLDIQQLIQDIPNFEPVPSISSAQFSQWDSQRLNYQLSVTGLPFVVSTDLTNIASHLFTPQWLKAHHESNLLELSDLRRNTEKSWTVGKYIDFQRDVQREISNYNYNDSKRKLLYLNKMKCPDTWRQALESIIQPDQFYLNDCDGSPPKGRRPAGDLMSLLLKGQTQIAKYQSAENLVLYMGYESTFTPLHHEKCATIGHNIMLYASQNGFDTQSQLTTSRGSSIWFMTARRDRLRVIEYLKSRLQGDVDSEEYLLSLQNWSDAPFTVYIHEQNIGDLIFIPPLTPHQVHNRGTWTIKTGWNRTTPDTLALAFGGNLFNQRMVCRPEEYHCKSITFRSLHEYARRLLLNYDTKSQAHPKLIQDFVKLFGLFQNLLLSESFGAATTPQLSRATSPDAAISCSFCNSNIFNRFLYCGNCLDSRNTGYTICMDCFVMGRSCRCFFGYEWVEQHPWTDLVGLHRHWAEVALSFSPNSQIEKDFGTVRDNCGINTTAEICEEQHFLRQEWGTKTLEVVGGAQPWLTKRPDQRAGSIPREVTGICHFDHRHEFNWRQARCDTCSRNFCWSLLWKSFGQSPSDILSLSDWLCPLCRGICNCRDCITKEIGHPFYPDFTVNGFDTSSRRDPRSHDHMVDTKLDNSQLVVSFLGRPAAPAN